MIFTQQNAKQSKIAYQFDVTSQGLCTFDGDSYYQLQTSSRFSFLGCWLNLTPITITAQKTPQESKTKQIFIYRDSLSEQDFSRLAWLLKSLSANG